MEWDKLLLLPSRIGKLAPRYTAATGDYLQYLRDAVAVLNVQDAYIPELTKPSEKVAELLHLQRKYAMAEELASRFYKDLKPEFVDSPALRHGRVHEQRAFDEFKRLVCTAHKKYKYEFNFIRVDQESFDEFAERQEDGITHRCRYDGFVEVQRPPEHGGEYGLYAVEIKCPHKMGRGRTIMHRRRDIHQICHEYYIGQDFAVKPRCLASTASDVKLKGVYYFVWEDVASRAADVNLLKPEPKGTYPIERMVEDYTNFLTYTLPRAVDTVSEMTAMARNEEQCRLWVKRTLASPPKYK